MKFGSTDNPEKQEYYSFPVKFVTRDKKNTHYYRFELAAHEHIQVVEKGLNQYGFSLHINQ